GRCRRAHGRGVVAGGDRAIAQGRGQEPAGFAEAAERAATIGATDAAVTHRRRLGTVSAGRRAAGRAVGAVGLRTRAGRGGADFVGHRVLVEQHVAFGILDVERAADRGAGIAVGFAAAAAGHRVVADRAGVVATGGAELAERERAAAEG